MRKSISAALIAAAAATAACSHERDEDGGPAVSRAFQVGNFTALEAAGPFDVTVRTGTSPGVQVRGNQKLVEKLVVEVKGDKLVIRPEERHGWFHWGSTHGKAQIAVMVSSDPGRPMANALITGAGKELGKTGA